MITGLGNRGSWPHAETILQDRGYLTETIPNYSHPSKSIYNLVVAHSEGTRLLYELDLSGRLISLGSPYPKFMFPKKVEYYKFSWDLIIINHDKDEYFDEYVLNTI